MTEIPYCDETWNVTAGCTKCSPGCENDWAERMAKRLKGKGIRGYDKVVDKDGWTNHIELMPWNLNKPLHWRKPRRIFVNSMSDLFHTKVPFEFIDKVHAAMIMAYRNKCYHTYLIFTKRIKRMLEYYSSNRRKQLFAILEKDYDEATGFFGINWPFPNLQLILSLSTQAEADKKISILLQIPAAVRGLSLEPLLEPVKIPKRYLPEWVTFPNGSKALQTIDRLRWIVVGCESGPKRRPCKIEWVRSIVQQCQAASVPVYVKQLSINGKVSRKMSEWPEELRIQQYPERS